jgi:predicted permease
MRLLRDITQDLRCAARTLRASPAFTAMVVLTLALGLGANAAIFSLVNAVLLRPLPVQDPGRLALLSDGTQPCARRLGTPTGPANRRLVYSYPLYKSLREHVRELEGLAGQEGCATPSIVVASQAGARDDRASERADGRAVTANYFGVLGVPAALGRTFLPEDETAPGANPVVVLSHGYWQRRFGGDPGVVGSRLTVNGQPYTVVGVTAPGFTGAETGSRTDFWVPVTMTDQLTRLGLDLQSRHYSFLLLLGRLAPGATLATAEASADVAYHQWIAEDAELAGYERNEPTHVRLDPAATGIAPVRGTFRDALLVLMAGVGLLLLIVCLNVSHLVLARAVKRQRELSIRTALGASRGRLVRQLCAEGVLLAALGTGLGALATGWLSDGLLAVARSGRWETPLALEVATDGRVVGFVALVAFVTAVLVGLVPAWQATRTDVQQALRAGAPAVAGGSRRLVSRVLLASQVAFSLVLLVGAGLLAGTLGRLRAVPTGLDVEHVLMADVNVQNLRLGEERELLLYEELQRRLTALPGVRGASLSLDGLLKGGGPSWHIFGGKPRQKIQIVPDIVTPGYFETVGMPPLRGRTFTPADRANGPRVAVINETLARYFFGGVDSAVGARYQVDLDRSGDVEIVGVVADAKVSELRKRTRPMIFTPAGQPHGLPIKLSLLSLQVRAVGDPALLGPQVRAAVREVQPDLPLMEMKTLRVQLDSSLMRERLLATLATALGVAALFLVCLGLYGVIAQWAEQRTREIGVRMALGATAGGVRWLVLRQGFAMVIVGVAIGIPAAAGAGQLLKSVLFGVKPVEVLALAGAALAMFAVATAAAYLPARRASRVEPMVALRTE